MMADSSTYLIVGAALTIAGLIAFSAVLGATLLAGRFRLPISLAVFAAGSWATYELMGGSEFWPNLWAPVALTISGGAVGLFVVFYRHHRMSLRRAFAASSSCGLVAIASAFLCSYLDANRATTGTVFLQGYKIPAAFSTEGQQNRQGIYRVRFVEDAPSQPETLRNRWTWVQDNGVPWHRFENSAELPFLFETDSGSGPSSSCAYPRKDDAARKWVELQISLRWRRKIENWVFPPPTPNLEGLTVFRLGPCGAATDTAVSQGHARGARSTSSK